MVRLALVIVLGCTLERDERLRSGHPVWYWLTVGAMVAVSTSTL
jgi:hypothetical protein